MVAAPSIHKNTRWAREYETIYILHPTTDKAEVEKLAERLKEIVARFGAKLTKLDNWGQRRLAYPIKKQSRGLYVLLKYVGFGDAVAEIERTLRLADAVVRFQTVQVGSEIDLGQVAVDPEETKFRHVETDLPESEPDLAERLGMVERKRAPAPVEEDVAGEAGAEPEGADAAPEAAAADVGTEEER